MLKVAFVGAFSASLVDVVRKQLTIPCDIILGDEKDIISRLGDVDVMVTMAFSHEMAKAAPHLKLVQVPGAGLDRIDRGALTSGIRLANVYGHETGIAEYVIGAMLALTRSFARLDTVLRRGEWASQWAVGTLPPPLWPELAGKTLCILGFGHIGQALARRARAFDMEVCALRRHADGPSHPDVAFFGGPDDLDDILQRADYLAVTLSLSPSTRDLMGERQLRLMKPTSFLINVARAEIISEPALYRALANREIAGAALDVWYRYPSAAEPTLPARHPFHELDNVLMTPHVSGWTEGMLEARSKLIAENICRAAKGEHPVNGIEPEKAVA